MSVFRMYTGDDGESHIEALNVSPHDDVWPTESVNFREVAPGTFRDWHPAPRRRWFFMLGGQFELAFGDGTSTILSPGDATLIEDVTGRGHQYRVVSDVPMTAAVVELSD